MDEQTKACARKAVSRAIQRGQLVRPLACEQCGRELGLNSRGRAAIHAHHEDYTKPLDVKWLCRRCHVAVEPSRTSGERNGAYTRPDRVRKGVEHGRAKVNDDIVREIRRRRAIEGLTFRALGQLYGLHRTTVSDIVSGQFWRHVEDIAVAEVSA